MFFSGWSRFRNQNAFYSGLGVDFQIEFCLAKRDTQGLASSGIVRHQSIYTDMSIPGAASEIYSIATWNPEEYINIRIVSEVCRAGNCSLAGFAAMPPAHGEFFDGLVMNSTYAGTTRKDAIVVTHEIGHYLGLFHTFLEGCANDDCLSNGDRVCDTPPDNMTGPFPCDVIYNTCITDEDDASINNPFRSIALGGIGDQPDMIQNFMDYSAYSCYDRFTTGQKSRVHFFLQSGRSSLLSSKSCLEPCANEPFALFIPSEDTIIAGGTLILDNTSSFATQYSWYINGVLVGHAQDTSFIFNTPGTYHISLTAGNGLIECSTSSFESTIVVFCRVEAEFTYVLNGSDLIVIDQSNFSDSIEWIIHDGAGNILHTSHEETDTIDLTGIPYIQICQYAFDEYCNDRKCIYVSLSPSGVEICNNQIDDDADQLVDLFDPDCPCTDSTYQAVCEIPCQYIPDSFPDLTLRLKWQSEVIGNDRGVIPNIIVGNADKSDSGIEVLTKKCIGDPSLDNVQNKLLILDAATGLSKREFICSPTQDFYDDAFISMGDIDGNGVTEVFNKFWDTIFCYNTDGSLQWVSDQLNMGRGSLINLIDFNEDGISEVYCGNNIINAENGKLLVNNPLSAGCNILNGAQFSICSYYHTIAADLLPTPGLELAAGNMVYTIQINNLNGMTGNTMTPSIADSPVLDGITSVGDIDGDGELDVINVRDISFPDGGGIWVWNPRTGDVIASAISGPSGGVPFIGDVDGDCAPEIGITFEKQLRMYKYNGTSSLQLLYNLPTTDESGFTGITMFDFNQDGKHELVYRDETDLRIINGSNGITLASYPVKSGTGLEYPVIADVDNDGQAEILVNGYLNDPTEQRVFCFESAATPWAPARSVWNQPGYNVTNVNDDLTIPRYPQNPAKPLTGHENCLIDTCATPYNAFNVQATYRTQAGCVQFPAYDLTIDIESYSCVPDSVTICFSVENTSSLELQQEIVHHTVWPSNPFTTNTIPVFTNSILYDLRPGEKTSVCFTTALISNLDSIFVVINDPGMTSTPYTFPHSTLPECDYQNNMDMLELNLAPKVLYLGPDITKCESEVITLSAGTGFSSYLWSDNSNDSLYSSDLAGAHFVETTDQCSRVYRDTINFNFDNQQDIQLGIDTSLCAGHFLAYSLQPTYDWIQWLPSENINCDTCFNVQVASDTAIQLIAVAGKGNCVYQDTVAIEVNQPFTEDTLIKFCPGDTIQFKTLELTTPGSYTFEIEPCDTLFNIIAELNPTDTSTLNLQLCNGDSINFDDIWIKSPGMFISHLTNTFGCDSIVNLTLSFGEPISHFETINACEGDSVFVLNQWVHSNMTLTNTLVSADGCDSTVSVEVLFSPYFLQNDTVRICDGDSVLLNGEWVREPGIFSDTINSVPCDIIQITELLFIPNNFTTQQFVLCPGDSILINQSWLSAPATIQDTLQNSSGCDSINRSIIDVVPPPGSPTIEFDCATGIISLSISADPVWQIFWNNGDTTNQTTYIDADSASLQLFAEPSCQKEFSIELPVIPSETDIPILKDTLIPTHTLFLALPLDSSQWKVDWHPKDLFSCSNCLTTTISAIQNTIIIVTLTHKDGCVYIDSFNILIPQASTDFYIPNIFSPNGDGYNDIWHIFQGSKGNIELLEVFDRWGNMVHRGSQTENNLDWDGTYQNQLLPSSVYAYKLQYMPESKSESVVLYGNLTLIR